MTPEVLFKRILSRLGAVNAQSSAPDVGPVRPLWAVEETLLGIYRNHAHPDVVFTNQGVYVLNEPPGVVRYTDILDVEMPEHQEKNQQNDIILLTNTGTRLVVPIDGGTKSTRDVFEVCRFLMRASEASKR